MTSYLLIFGGSKGIGKECLKLMKNDYDLIFNISREPTNEEGVTDIQHDLSTGMSKIKNRLNEIPDGHKITIVYSASLLTKDTIETYSDDDFKNAFTTNIESLAQICRALVPKMGKGSSIVIIGSTLSEKAAKNSFLYTATKHAQVGLMRSIVQDTAGKGIHSCVVCPGFTDTEMLRKHLHGSKEAYEYIKSMTTFGRLITPEEIAKEIKNIAGSSVFNGSVIHLNMGQKEI